MAHWPGYVLTVDGRDRITSLNRNTHVVDAERDLGRDLFDFISAAAQADFRADLAAARSGTAGVTRRSGVRLPDGTSRWYESRFIGIEASGVMIVSDDVTVEQHAKIALRLLADASHEFSEATADYERLLAVIARRLGEIIGDLCSIRALSADGTQLESGAAHHRDPRIRAWAHELSMTYDQKVGEGSMGGVAASGRPVFLPKVSAADFSATTSPQYRHFLETLNVGSVIVVPMQCQGKVVGVASLLRSGSERPYTVQELDLVQNLADHAALAISNARSYAAERVARAAAMEANETLRKSEAAHRLLFESSPIPLLVFDVETLGFLAVNEAATRLYGYSHDELLQMVLPQLVSPEGRAGLSERVKALAEEETVGVARHCRKDGSAFFAEHASRSVTFSGRLARFTLITDVTARHDAEEMRALLAAIVQSSNDAIVSRRLDGAITSWNAAAERLFGYPAEETIGRQISLIVPGDRCEEEREMLARVAAGERVEHCETMRLRKDGVTVPVSISLAPVLSASGKVVGASKTARDLREQQKTEEALRSASEQLRQAQKM
ncbi:MAG TPA: PAS domain S-box protein, partial [Polyangiaceae bacterium]